MKKKYYLTLDTETATLPFANEIAKTAKQKQNIAIAKPLVYDIGWIITDRQGEVIKTVNYLVQETFFVPNVFNTAYYKDKRPQYMEMYKKGELKSLPWNDIIEILLEDLRGCDICAAYNAAFDFKKAIPFTERYIKALYSDWYNEWEERQFKQCEKIAFGSNTGKNEKYLDPIFELRNEEFPVVDLWGLSCERLINNKRYKDFCLENELVTASGLYFKTSAETTYQYIMKDNTFIESHTALDDAIIESQILTKALKKGKVEPILGAFPFRTLGETYKYVNNERPKYAEVLIKFIELYLEENKDRKGAYFTRLQNIVEALQLLL